MLKYLNPTAKSLLLRSYFLLAALEGGICLIFLLAIPADPKNAWILGYSPARLLMIASVLLGFAAAGWLAVRSRVDQAWLKKLSESVESYQRSAIFNLLVLSLSGAGSVGGILLLVRALQTHSAVWIRLAPVVGWGVALCLQTLWEFYLFGAIVHVLQRYLHRLLPRNPARWLPLILLVSVLLRLGILARVNPPIETTRLQRIAANLVERHEYAFCNPYFPFCGPGNDQTASVEPIPVFIFAGFMSLFGDQFLAPPSLFKCSWIWSPCLSSTRSSCSCSMTSAPPF